MANVTELVTSNLSEMAHALSKADPELIENFLYSLFTASEADEIAKRWALVKQIASGRPQREIAKDLGLSLCKITRGSRKLKKESSAFKRMLNLAGFEVPDVDSAAPRREAPDPRGCYSRVAFTRMMSSRGTSACGGRLPVATAAILSTESMPSTTLPKAQ